MSSVVCQGLQSYLEPWPKLTVTRPYFALSLNCARKAARISDSDSEKQNKEKNINDQELENNNNYTESDSDKNNKNQSSSNGADMGGGWSFIQALANTSQCPKAEEEKKEKEKLYIHPLLKRSSSKLSEKSLEMCTENLGSETGSVIREDEILKSSESYKERDRPKSSVRQLTKVNSKEFPPPLTTISGSSQVKVRTHREGGRLVMTAVRVPCSHSYFEAERGDGCLRLHFSKNYSQRFDSESEFQAKAAVEVEEEEADSEEEEEEEEGEEEQEAAAEEEEAEFEKEGEEEVEEDDDDDDDDERREDVKYRGGGGGGEYERGRRRRCNECSGHRNKLMLIQEPCCWVASS